MARPLLVFIAAFSLAAAVFAQREGNSSNWCRGGAFPMDSEEFKIGTVTGTKNEQVHFYNDLSDECPASEKCKDKAYIVPGDKVVISRSFKGFACSWYIPAKGMPTVGWVKLDQLKTVTADVSPRLSDWLGEWRFSENSITFARHKLAGYLNVTGQAFWQGLGDNIHIGELGSRAEPQGNLLKYGEADTDEFACKATMRLIDSFLVVRDNLNCGGANVTFSGVYRKKK